jgi:hypothetical protein
MAVGDSVSHHRPQLEKHHKYHNNVRQTEERNFGMINLLNILIWNQQFKVCTVSLLYLRSACVRLYAWLSVIHDDSEGWREERGRGRVRDSDGVIDRVRDKDTGAEQRIDWKRSVRLYDTSYYITARLTASAWFTTLLQALHTILFRRSNAARS